MHKHILHAESQFSFISLFWSVFTSFIVPPHFWYFNSNSIVHQHEHFLGCFTLSWVRPIFLLKVLLASNYRHYHIFSFWNSSVLHNAHTYAHHSKCNTIFGVSVESAKRDFAKVYTNEKECIFKTPNVVTLNDIALFSYHISSSEMQRTHTHSVAIRTERCASKLNFPKIP